MAKHTFYSKQLRVKGKLKKAVTVSKHSDHPSAFSPVSVCSPIT